MRIARLIFLIWLLPIVSHAGPDTLEYVRLSLGTVPWILNEHWEYLPGDDLRRAQPGFQDGGWTVQPHILKDAQVVSSFPGIGWWRREVTFDSSLAGRPIALVMHQEGASEVYLNGKFLHGFGIIRPDGRHIRRYTSGGKPFVFQLPAAGTYLIAVRYAQQKSSRPPGFWLNIDEAGSAITQDRSRVIGFSSVVMFLMGLFMAFSLVHAVMYVYYRASRSNIWFALFSLSLSLVLSTLFAKILQVPWIVDLLEQALPYFVLASAFSLSGFINTVFDRKRIWIRVILAVTLPVIIFAEDWQVRIMVFAIIAVSFETLFTILFALIRRLPGSRIIGSGLLLFSGLMLYLFGSIVLKGDDALILVGHKATITMIVGAIAILSIPVSMSIYLARSFASMNKSMKRHLAEVERLSAEARNQEAEKQRLLEGRREELEREVAIRTEELRGQKQKSDDLLLNILPSEVAEELKETGKSEARLYNEVSVLFTDFVDFTQMSEHLSPSALVAEIDHCFKTFDEIITRHGLEKIKTVGDAYIAVSGMPAANPDHAKAVINAGLEIRSFVEARRLMHPDSFGIRIGVHSGPVVAGIVGVKKFAYDIWGDTVNTAARMEQHSEPGRLNISETTYALVRDSFRFIPREEQEVKHKGRMRMYFVEEAGVGVAEARSLQ